MHIDRRRVLAGTTAALAGLSLPSLARTASDPSSRSDKSLLILGGTGFLGPHVVAAARARGWEVTLFNRGRSAPELFPDIETLIGDRNPDRGAGLSALEGDRHWDYVVDTTSYVPRLTRVVTELLADRVERYALISTVSVYADFSEPGMDETAAVGRLDDPTDEELTGLTYGPLKALCEEAAEEVLPGRVAHVRPGLIVGPRDSTDRFTYWPVRIREGGRVLAPGSIDDPVQFIDARDLAEFTIGCLAGDRMGTFNATGPTYGLSIGGLVYGCRAAVESDARFQWISEEAMEGLELSGWSDLPVWTPPAGEMAGMGAVSIRRAIEAGLHSRPLADTVRDTLAWWDEQPAERQVLRWGLSREREAQALATLDGVRQG
ncbi:MAG: NAD-dependent epimerase/dehydratase family protein [Planctomycetota bacterium]|jgi:2'-hydroxyisoflavone reductase